MGESQGCLKAGCALSKLHTAQLECEDRELIEHAADRAHGKHPVNARPDYMLLTTCERTRSCPVHSCVDMCTVLPSLRSELPESRGLSDSVTPMLSSSGAWLSVKHVAGQCGEHCDE